MRKREESRLFGLSSWKMELPLTEIGKLGGAHCGELGFSVGCKFYDAR
jgi:hypothetical protein